MNSLSYSSIILDISVKKKSGLSLFGPYRFTNVIQYVFAKKNLRNNIVTASVYLNLRQFVFNIIAEKCNSSSRIPGLKKTPLRITGIFAISCTVHSSYHTKKAPCWFSSRTKQQYTAYGDKKLTKWGYLTKKKPRITFVNSHFQLIFGIKYQSCQVN